MGLRIVIFFITLFVGTLMAGGSDAGMVSGKISNATHPATVTVKEKNGQRTYNMRTNKKGNYSIFLPVGDYDVLVGNTACGKIKSFDVPVRQDVRCQ